jgi:hypothetical protein
VKTDDLIVQLAGAAKPIARLRRPAVRLGRWLASAVAVAGTAVLAIGARADFESAIAAPAYAVSLVLLMGTAAGAASAALILAVPGAERSSMQRWWPVAGVVTWSVQWSAIAAAALPIDPSERLFHAACAIEIAMIATLVGFVLLRMVQSAAPLRPAWAAATTSVAALACAAAATQVICPISAPAHQLVSHVSVAALVGLAGVAVGRRHLRA